MHTLVRLIPLTSLALALGCKEASQPPTNLGPRQAVWVPDAAATLAFEYYSGFDQPSQLILADASSLQMAWAQLYRGLQPKPPLPSVNFRTERVVLAALGTRSHGGYSIRIDSLVAHELGTIVYVTATAPGSDCFTTQALTEPVHLVRVSPPPKGPVVFQQQAVVHRCS